VSQPQELHIAQIALSLDGSRQPREMRAYGSHITPEDHCVQERLDVGQERFRCGFIFARHHPLVAGGEHHPDQVAEIRAHLRTAFL